MKVTVRVKPNAKHPGVVEHDDKSLDVSVHASPHEGEANKELIELLADYFEVSKSSIEIVGGHASRRKVVEISLWQKR
ncbi:MAG: hypothetical protein COU90_02235 [Candidatus Ryanbacteria bacterium CG10_big_fil_rev_8_21_14_0_10_43_42]|uniref:UPF0235 protein COU90_02235 n=1 Tax=Candidatus Ryanbacteria bacterium CG10_big_fil_rev_8_21_14_0_10_43_42 TaxID=1974864 RepID=A0A2M8KXL7_9BACT|nr:MAG: hypothetical protein COU90_02235 [Candidatus Ryanbacteria bacterium CG10_big_fil_rev_8_21_14_0_10_43_42]